MLILNLKSKMFMAILSMDSFQNKEKPCTPVVKLLYFGRNETDSFFSLQFAVIQLYLMDFIFFFRRNIFLFHSIYILCTHTFLFIISVLLCGLEQNWHFSPKSIELKEQIQQFHRCHQTLSICKEIILANDRQNTIDKWLVKCHAPMPALYLQTIFGSFLEKLPEAMNKRQISSKAYSASLILISNFALRDQDINITCSTGTHLKMN